MNLHGAGFVWSPLADDWEEGFAALEQFKIREHHCRVDRNHLEGTYRLGAWIKEQRKLQACMPVDRRQRLEALGFEWDPLASNWEDGFIALEQFKAKCGHCRVSQRHLEGTYKLGQWVGTQRRTKSTLLPERIQRLDALGFEWDPFATDWQEGFAALERFKAREGHCRVPVIHTEGNHGLGQWVSTQRKQIDSMPVERKQKLEALGLEWNPFKSAWQQGFAMLAKFKARVGHCRVPEGQIEESFKLGNWVANQRRKRDSMTVENRKRLDAMGFQWNPRASDWEDGFAALARFKAREGHCCVPQSHIEKDYKLGQWVSGQRGQKDRIPVEIKQRLDAMGFVWRIL